MPSFWPCQRRHAVDVSQTGSLLGSGHTLLNLSKGLELRLIYDISTAL